MKIIDYNLMTELTRKAMEAPRKRAHYNLHQSLDEPIHRLVMAVEPGSYIRPHRHLSGGKFEFFTIFRGRGSTFIFTQDGTISKRIDMAPGSDVAAIELTPETWHSFVAWETGTIVCEVKPGPYFPVPASDAAQWAPAEGEEKVAAILDWLSRAKVGDKFLY